MIKTNKMIFEINRNLLNEKYYLFKISTNQKYFSHTSRLLDDPLLTKGIQSILYNDTNSILVLLVKDENVCNQFKNIIRNDLSDDTALEEIGFNKAKENEIVQLLLNALNNYETEEYRFNNLSGKFYCYNPAWEIKDNRRDEPFIYQIPSIELKINDENMLLMNVRTFTSTKLRKKITFKKRSFNEYPQYILKGINLVRKPINCNEPSYILRQLDNKKSFIKYLEFSNFDSFNKSKMGILSEVINSFNKKYNHLAHIEFETINKYGSLLYSNTSRKENLSRVVEILQNENINFVDCINSEESTLFINNLKQLLFKKYGILAKNGLRIDKKSMNIRVIHNAEYYLDAGTKDCYKKYNDATVQNITIEDFFDKAEYAISTVVYNLVIKNDLRNGTISLFDWRSLGFDQDVCFGLPNEKETGTSYVYMSIHPDGSFVINEEQFDLLNESVHSELNNVFIDNLDEDNKIVGIIQKGNGTINTISETNLFSIPEITKIRQELVKGNNKLRGKDIREELLSSCLDIRSYDSGTDNSLLYFVGTIGEGMRAGVKCAAVIREIKCLKGIDLLFSQLLPTMSVLFVRNEQLTVVPFPFKYIREYLKLVEN